MVVYIVTILQGLELYGLIIPSKISDVNDENRLNLLLLSEVFFIFYFFHFSNFYLNALGRSTSLTLESLIITSLKQKNLAGPNLKNLKTLKVKQGKIIFNVPFYMCVLFTVLHK